MTYEPSQVAQWKQAGRISLWRYVEHSRHFPGWHLNADQDGCQSLARLLELFSIDCAGSRTVELAAPTEAQLRVPNNKGGLAPCIAPAKLKITFSQEPDHWSFPPETEPATLAVGKIWIEAIRQGLADIPMRRGDYSVGPRQSSLPLWFWWSEK
jgi:hypothetical protein